MDLQSIVPAERIDNIKILAKKRTLNRNEFEVE